MSKHGGNYGGWGAAKGDQTSFIHYGLYACCLRTAALDLEAPVMTQNGIIFLFFSFSMDYTHHGTLLSNTHSSIVGCMHTREEEPQKRVLSIVHDHM